MISYRIQVISISDTASRHNSPANPHAVTKEVRAAGVVGKETTVGDIDYWMVTVVTERILVWGYWLSIRYGSQG